MEIVLNMVFYLTPSVIDDKLTRIFLGITIMNFVIPYERHNYYE